MANLIHKIEQFLGYKEEQTPSLIGLDILAIVEGYLKIATTASESYANLPAIPEMSARAKRLEYIGFTNEKGVAAELEMLVKAHQQRYKLEKETTRSRMNREKAVEAFNLLLEVRKDYPEALILPLDEFRKLMKRHRLMCATFDQYIGDVPDWAITEIERLQRNTFPNRIDKPAWADNITSLIPVSEVRVGFLSEPDEFREIQERLNEFPFVLAAYKRLFGTHFTMIEGDTYHDVNVELETRVPRQLFICAPKSMIKGRVAYTKVPDPFICARVRQGILLFTRWGEEANDAYIRKMERINQLLDQIKQQPL